MISVVVDCHASIVATCYVAAYVSFFIRNMFFNTRTPSSYYHQPITIGSISPYYYTPSQTHSTPLSPSSPSYENDSLYYYHSYAHTHHHPTCILSSPTSAPSTDILIITILTIKLTTTAMLVIGQDVTCCTIYINYYFIELPLSALLPCTLCRHTIF